MENQNINTNNTNANNNTPNEGGRTFTQEEVNRIVSERLAKDREKRAVELEERERAVKARELAVIATEKLAASGLPKELASVMKYDDEASLDSAIEQICSLRGFKDDRDNSHSEDKKHIIENKLPEQQQIDLGDYQIRDAFGLRK